MNTCLIKHAQTHCISDVVWINVCLQQTFARLGTRSRSSTGHSNQVGVVADGSSLQRFHERRPLAVLGFNALPSGVGVRTCDRVSYP